MKNKKTIRANIAWLVVVGIIGVLLSAGGTALAIYNWEDAYVEDFMFPVNKSSVEKNWVSLKGTGMQIQSAQTTGNSSCKYSLYTKQRYASYNTIYNNMTYSKNDAGSKIYTYDFGSWKDYMFKMNKTVGTGTKSVVKLMVEKPSK